MLDVFIYAGAWAYIESCPPVKLKLILLTALVVVVYILHQDSWNWKRADPFIFGFLPIGLAYQAAYSILAALMMAVLVRTVWPKHLEDVESDDKSQKGDRP